MASAVTVLSRQRRMKDFFNLEGSKYILIGRTTSWQDDMYPPLPTGNETSVEELIGCKLVKNQWYCKMLTNPTQAEKEAGIYYKGHYYYVTVDPVLAVENGCTGVMLFTQLDRDELPLETFRQVGVQVLVQNNAEVMLPITFNTLTDKGNLEIIENRKPQTRADDQEEDLYICIEF